MPPAAKDDFETISVSSEGRKRARTKTFAAELRDMRMAAANDALHPTRSVSGQGAMISKALATGAARDPQEVPKWNPRDDPEHAGSPGTANFRAVPRRGLQMIDARNRVPETPPPGHYEKTSKSRGPDKDKHHKKDQWDDNKINTAHGRDTMSPEGHFYHSMLRGYSPPTPKKRSLSEKEQKRMAYAEKVITERTPGPEFHSPMQREMPRPSLTSHPYSRIAAEFVGADEAPDVVYRVSKKAYYNTVAKGPIFFNSAHVVGRDKPIFPPRDWERGADGQLSMEQRDALERSTCKTKDKPLDIKRATGRDANVKIMTNLPHEATPDTIYKHEEAWNSSKPRSKAGPELHTIDRQQSSCHHRFGTSTHWAGKSSLVHVPAEQGREIDGGVYNPRNLTRPQSLPDFRLEASRTQMFLQSNDEANNSSQISAGKAPGQHFSSQRKIRSPRDNWGRPPYSVLDQGTASRSFVEGKIRGYETPGITTPVIKMGRSARDAKRRVLTAGSPGGHTDFDSMEARKRWNPRDGTSNAPPPQTYTPNHNAVKSRVSTVDFHQMSMRDASSWGPPGQASHLELASPNHSAVHPRSLTMKMTKGVRNTSMVLKTEGCDTAYSPRDVNRNVGNCPVRIGGQAGRSKHSGNRFENQFASPGDFMPSHIDSQTVD